MCNFRDRIVSGVEVKERGPEPPPDHRKEEKALSEQKLCYA